MNTPQGRSQQLRRELLGHEGTLYALLDAARDYRIEELISASDHKREMFYEGELAELMKPYSPYLVELSADSSLLLKLLEEGWGNSWGIYAIGPRPFKPTLRHLRSIWIEQDEAGKDMYLRFYDPRVMRRELPSYSPRRQAEIFGDLSCFLLEGSDPAKLLKLSLEQGQLLSQQTAL